MAIALSSATMRLTMVHAGFGDALLPEALARPVEQAGRDDLVVAADEDGHAAFTRRAGRTLDLGHDQWVSRWPSLSRLASR